MFFSRLTRAKFIKKNMIKPNKDHVVKNTPIVEVLKNIDKKIFIALAIYTIPKILCIPLVLFAEKIVEMTKEYTCKQRYITKYEENNNDEDLN